jgi:hypothetical protein
MHPGAGVDRVEKSASQFKLQACVRSRCELVPIIGKACLNSNRQGERGIIATTLVPVIRRYYAPAEENAS